MRSRPAPLARVVLFALILGTLPGLSGCQVGRSFFQMSSDAPVPFFGMDLLPKREKKSPTAGVSRFQDETIPDSNGIEHEVEPVAGEAPKPPKSALARSWDTLLGRSPTRESLVIPAAAATGSAHADEAPIEQFR